MSLAKRPSKITLPEANKGWNNLLEFLTFQFPQIGTKIWMARFTENKVHWLSGEPATADTPFMAGKTLCYYREVTQEPSIPFEHRLVFRNEHILVAYKPHFLPVTPGGQYVNECLLERLRQEHQLPDLVPLHRLDKDTAGLVLFSLNAESRGIYSQLFAKSRITKHYQAIASVPGEFSRDALPECWRIENRLEKGSPGFIMQEVAGEINARSEIKLVDIKEHLGLFELIPVTGKTHQLRLHMMKIGMPILNDNFYPVLQPRQPLRFDYPLQLLATELLFDDPLTGQSYHFDAGRRLSL